MDATHFPEMVIHVDPSAKYGKQTTNKSYESDMNICQKTHKFDLKVKGQRRTGIFNARDISWNGNASIYQI